MQPTRVVIRLSDREVRHRLSAALHVADEGAPVSDSLIRATVGAATHVVRGAQPPTALFSGGACGLVDDALRALASGRWHVAP